MAQNRFRRNPSLSDEIAAKYKVNHQIRASQVRLVGENIPIGVYSLSEALRIADEAELDLVEISPKADPPVCRVVDFKKFLYEQKKKHKEIKAKTSKVVVKEVRFGPNTDEHDYQFKLRHAEKFLNEGAKVKAFVFFKGRSIIYKDQGEEVLRRFIDDLSEISKLDQQPRLEGKRMIIFLSPLKAKKKN